MPSWPLAADGWTEADGEPPYAAFEAEEGDLGHEEEEDELVPEPVPVSPEQADQHDEWLWPDDEDDEAVAEQWHGWGARKWDSWWSWGDRGSSWYWNPNRWDDWYDNSWNRNHYHWTQPTTSAAEGSGDKDGRLSDQQLRDFNVASMAAMSELRDGRWVGLDGAERPASSMQESGDGQGQGFGRNSRTNEKLPIPVFSGEGSDQEVGKTARSYVRKVQAWLRSTKLPPNQRALALYSSLTDKAWVYAEELDIDRLGSEGGMTYYLDWVQTRFMEVEITKVSQMMTDLFRRCRRRPEQSVRDFNVEFERLVLRLHEVRCELPPVIKAWLYMDKLKLSESEEVALLASVGNEYDAKKLQQAALIHDRALRHGFSDKGNGKFGGGKWSRSVHMTTHDDEPSDADSVADGQGVADAADDELMDEETAMEHHTAFMAYQGAKAKYRDALRGRGTDPDALKKSAEERLKAAKARSYCSACKRRGHWHKDVECPLNQKKAAAAPATQTAQMCHTVFMTYGGNETLQNDLGKMLAIVDTACTRSVAGYDWFERYYKIADEKGIPVVTEDVEDTFKFGASKVFQSNFAVWAWFSTEGKWFAVKVSIVPCSVPLLLSRVVLAGLGMQLDVAAHHAKLGGLGLEKVVLATSPTGHPALVVSQFPAGSPPFLAVSAADEVWIPDTSKVAYMVRAARPHCKLFHPKKVSVEVQNLLEQNTTISSSTYYLWWRGANQSRDFWMETADEMIRVHVCPRRDLFDPSLWQTQLHDLKGKLLQTLSGHRVTEVVPCLSEGLEVHRFVDDVFSAPGKLPWHGLWIGRSRFSKAKPFADRPNSTNASTYLTMADEQGRVDGRVASPRSGVSLELDSAGVADPAAGTTEDRRGQGQHTTTVEGPVQDEFEGAAGRVRQVEGCPASQADAWSTDVAATRSPSDPGVDRRPFWSLPRMALQRSSNWLSSMGRGGGGQERQPVSGPGAFCNLGKGESGNTPHGQGGPSQDVGERSRDIGGGPAAESPGVGGCFGQQPLEQSVFDARPSRPEGTPGFRDGRGPAPGRSTSRDPSPGASSSCFEDVREEQASTLNPRLVTGDVEKYVFMVATEDIEDVSDYNSGEEVKYDTGGFELSEDEAPADTDSEDAISTAGEGENYEADEGAGQDYKVEENMGNNHGHGGDPKTKALAGMKRRRWQKMNFSQKSRQVVKNQLNKLLHVLMVTSVAVGSWTQEVIGDPVQDLWQVFQSTHRHTGCDDADVVDCFEIFAGKSKISNEFARRRRGVLQPRDLLFGHDLRQQEQRREVMEELKEHRPRLVWLAPPCTFWCGYSRINYKEFALHLGCHFGLGCQTCAAHLVV